MARRHPRPARSVPRASCSNWVSARSLAVCAVTTSHAWLLASLSSPMSRLQQLPAALQRSLEQRSTLKVIACLMNFDAESVGRIARATGHGGADLVDVACDPALVL